MNDERPGANDKEWFFFGCKDSRDMTRDELISAIIRNEARSRQESAYQMKRWEEWGDALCGRK